MDRAALLAMLIRRYGPILEEASVPADADGLASPLDATEAAVADLTSRAIDPDPWVEWLARYYTLDFIADRLTAQTNVSDSGSTVSLNQLFTNVQARLSEARGRVAWYVAPPAPLTDPPAGTWANGGRLITFRGDW